MKTLLLLILTTLSSTLFAQQSNDRRGFQGKVTSLQTANIDLETSEKDTQMEEQNDIEFSIRNITIGNIVYDIVKCEFDGKKTNTYTCTKRRGTFIITYIPSEVISVHDEANDTSSVGYYELTEK